MVDDLGPDLAERLAVLARAVPHDRDRCPGCDDREARRDRERACRREGDEQHACRAAEAHADGCAPARPAGPPPAGRRRSGPRASSRADGPAAPSRTARGTRPPAPREEPDDDSISSRPAARRRCRCPRARSARASAGSRLRGRAHLRPCGRRRQAARPRLSAAGDRRDLLDTPSPVGPDAEVDDEVDRGRDGRHHERR